MGFKAFMCASGIDDFPVADDHTLHAGMRRIAELDSILLLHAENAGIVDALAREAVAAGATGARDFIWSRPAVAELEAIHRAIFFAGETGCRIHIVHVSTAAGVHMVREAQARGVDVTCETCPHYLLYTEEDAERLAGAGKCAPPFRTVDDRAELWALLMNGTLPMVVSDHSPSTPDLKRDGDFFKVWGGISGCQTTRQLLLAGLHGQSMDLLTMSAVTATNIARRFRLASKGELAVGFDADMWLVDLGHEDLVRGDDLLYRNRFSAHEGHPIRGRTVRTIVRGQTVFSDGRPASRPMGRLLTPGQAAAI
jgi:allantoinase